MCTSVNAQCIHCKGNHLAGDKLCPTKKQVEKELQKQDRIILKNRYHQLLTVMEENDDIEVETSESVHSESSRQSTKISNKRQKKTSTFYDTKQKPNISYADIVSQNMEQNIPSTSYRRSDIQQPSKQKKTNNHENMTMGYKIIQEIISKLDFPVIFKDFLLKLLPPLLDSLWIQISDSLLFNLSLN